MVHNFDNISKSRTNKVEGIGTVGAPLWFGSCLCKWITVSRTAKMTQTDLDVSHCLSLSRNLVKHQTVCGPGRESILANGHNNVQCKELRLQEKFSLIFK